jgi:ABC-type methionine transport system ATPase subunit
MNLLLSLNRDEGITLVMVTHDVSMKFFADRVIWLRDGKIQRIEAVQESKKKETLDKLNEKLDEIRRKKEERKEKAPQQGRSVPSLAKANLTVRQPSDYKTHPEYGPSSKPLTDFTNFEH